jgi:two-component system sensor histidine kinase QseC
LLLGTAIGTGLVLSASALVLYTVVRTALWAEFDESLASKARSLAALVEQDGEEIELELDEDSLPEYKPAEHAEYYQFWTSGEYVLARSPSLGGGDLSRSGKRSDEPACASIVLPDGRRGRIVQITFTPRQEKNGMLWQPESAPAELILAVARETRDVDRALGWLRLLLACGCAGAILVSVLVLSWIVRRGLKPLGHVAAEIAAIGENDLSSRLGTGAAPGELAPVVTRLNDLLTRLEGAFARERAFTADVAHELRTPLAGLRSTLEVSLSKERAAAAYREAMAKSLAICQQMQRMVENLLELARADAGQVEVASETVDLVSLLKDCWTQFAERATERRLEVAWQLPESCLITTDHTKASLVLNNIFDNAVTYADAGGRVTIVLRQENGQASVHVANTGSIIAEADVEKVFDRFWRGDAARTPEDNKRRYGLGLPLCQKLITLLDGSITVSTASGGTFAVLLVFPV